MSEPMKQMRFETEVPAPLSVVWETIADYGRVHDWNPNLESAELLGGPARGVGAKRQCNMKNGKDFVREVVTAWDERRGMTIEVYDGTMPFERAELVVAVEPLGPDATQVVMDMRFAPKGGIGGTIMGAMAKPMFKHMIGKLFKGLSEHCATQHEANQPHMAGARAI